MEKRTSVMRVVNVSIDRIGDVSITAENGSGDSLILRVTRNDAAQLMASSGLIHVTVEDEV